MSAFFSQGRPHVNSQIEFPLNSPDRIYVQTPSPMFGITAVLNSYRYKTIGPEPIY